MPLDSGHDWSREDVVSGREIRERIEEQFPLSPIDEARGSNTASRYRFADGAPGGTIRGTVSDCVVSGNANNGITASASGPGVIVLAVTNTKLIGNANGIVANGGGSAVLVGGSTITGNNNGVLALSGGILYSYGDNRLNGNSPDGAFTAVIGTH